MRQKIFSQAEHELHTLPLEVELQTVFRVDVQSLADRLGWTVFEQRLKFFSELSHPADGVFGSPAQSEHLFELVEHNDGSEQPVARPPEIHVTPVKIFPKSFIRSRPWPIDSGSIQLRYKGVLDLSRERRKVLTVIKTQAEWKEVETL